MCTEHRDQAGIYLFACRETEQIPSILTFECGYRYNLQSTIHEFGTNINTDGSYRLGNIFTAASGIKQIWVLSPSLFFLDLDLVRQNENAKRSEVK